jgi:hypothetical protein
MTKRRAVCGTRARHAAVCLAHMYYDSEYSMSRLAMLKVVIALPSYARN